ncbi:MAG: hypothetical protein HY562_11855 [Ignavibacteriales bacterium]|nr:hypothetical protein [Ignavibacteriales bacterium]
MKTSSHTLTLCVSILLFAAASAVGQTVARVDSFFAKSLGRVKKLTVILPAKYSSETRYPVLYLLHGLGGNHEDWNARTKIVEYADAYPLVIVMPDGEDSWYVNSSAASGDRFEDYLIHDVRNYVLSRYSIDTTRQAIAGLSMGGYGALMLALRHPVKFLFAGDLSGSITVPSALSDTVLMPEKSLAPSLLKAFGRMTKTTRDAHDVFHLYKKTPRRQFPYFYMVIGIQDGFKKWIPAHHALAESLRVYGAAYEYHETQGGHNWQFWDREIQPLLKRMSQIMKF